MGSGIIGLSAAMAFTGVVPMLMILVLTAYLSHRSATMLVRVADAERAQTYGDAAYNVLGQRFCSAIQFTIVLGNFGMLVAYIVILGDFVEAIGDAVTSDGVDRVLWTLIVSCLVILPLSLKRDLNDLRATSFLSILFVVFFVVVLCVRSVDGVVSDGLGPGVKAARASTDFFRALPTAFFAFNCHTSVFPVYRSMEKQEVTRFDTVSRMSFVIVGSMYVAASVLGYLLFGSESTSNILSSFPTDDNLVSVATLCFAFTICFTYPIVMTALRISLHYLLFGRADMRAVSWYSETLAIFVAACAVGVAVNDVSLVFSITGSISSGVIAFVAPAVLTLKSKKHPCTAAETRFCYFLIVFGTVACVLGLVSSLNAALL